MNLSHIGNRFGKLLKATVSQIAGGTFVALASLLIVFGHAMPALAGTEYQSPAPLAEYVVDFPNTGSGVDMSPNYGFSYRLPLGVQFDRMQISVPSSQGTYDKSFVPLLGAWDTGFEPWNNINASVNGKFSAVLFPSVSSNSKVEPTTLQFIFSTTTTITSNSVRDLWFLLDPNSPYTDFAYNGSAGAETASTNGSNYAKTLSVPTIKLCNGSCDNNSFSPVPELTASPWGRLISPSNGASVQAGTVVPLRFQVNTGTSTADNVQIRFTSNLQTLVPYDYELTTTGLNDFTYNFSMPAVDDYIQLVVDVRSGTTSVYTSTTYGLNVRTSESGVGVNPQESQTCDDTSGLSWAICTTVAFLFIPSESSVASFMTAYSELGTKMPFVYISQASDLLTGLYTGTPGVVPTVAVSTGIGTITFISQTQIEAIPFVNLIRSLIAAGLWLMLFVVLYRKTLSIHDKQTV